MSSSLSAFAERRRGAAEILDHLSQATRAVPGVDTERAADRLAQLADRALAGRFVIQLIGCFSSGKSTLLNALLGDKVLPVKVNPCTAILTELVHAPEPSVEVRFTDGRAETMSPADFLERFQLRTADLSKAGAEAIDRFGQVERAVVGWPLPLLRDGAVMLDTPGLDDDPERTARTLASLPQADAIIFGLSASRFLTDLERTTLRRDLLPLGLTNLFFPVTMVDLLDALSDTPEADRRRMEERARQILGPLCTVEGVDRFDERCFFLDARGALRSRLAEDEAALDRSGILPLEAALERFLVQERGRAQLMHLATAATRIHEDLARQAQVDRATADASVAELRRRQEELAPRFEELAGIARLVRRRVDDFIQRQQAFVYQDLRDFLARTEEDLPEAVAAFDLGGLAGLDLLTPRGRDKVEAQLREQLDEWLVERVGQWRRALRPKVEGALLDLRQELAAEAADFGMISEDIVKVFAGTDIVLPMSDKAEVDPLERWLSVAVGAVFLSPGAMAAGWAEGYEGALKGTAGRIGAYLAIVAVGALLGPIGWAGLILYAVSDAVLLVLTGGSQLRRMREAVARNLEGKLVAQAVEARDEIREKVAEGLRPLRDALAGAAQADADELSELLERTIHAREEAARDAEERRESWEVALTALEEGVQSLRELTTDG